MIKRNMQKLIPVVAVMAILVFGGLSPASAEQEVRFASVSWTGVTVKTEIGVELLNTLGYDATNTMLSVPIAYKALSLNEADVFLGNWMPSMKTLANEYFNNGSVQKFVANMPGAKYTLAVPSYVAKGGLTHFKDIAKFGDKLEWKIYGIEEGNDGNEIIQSMIDKNMFGLGKFELIPSSEAGMLSQVMSFSKKDKWVVFLGWAPHYMNELIDITYLKGSTAETFGENDGTATVYTNIRTGFDKEQPNVALFLKNFTFPIAMMNQIMTRMHENPDLKPATAGMDWVKAHPEVYRKWLDGVTTADGKPALPVIEKHLAEMQ
jgi:glycine betaine/proline transport system substrate-binding protein